MPQNKTTKFTYRIPKKCPACQCEELIVLDEINVLCSECEWDNTQDFIKSGHFDHLVYEYERMLAEEKQDLGKDHMFDRYVDEHYADCDHS